MISAIRDFFDQHLSLRDTEDEVGEREVALATAALLYEVVLADQEVDAAEKDHVIHLLQRTFDFDPEQIREIALLAEQEVRDATDLFQFTRLINQHFAVEQRQAVVRNMWRVAMADGEIHHYEEHMIRRVSDLLNLHHHHFIRAKVEARGDGRDEGLDGASAES